MGATTPGAVAWLVKRVDPLRDHSLGLRMAAQYASVECVQLVLPHSCATVMKSAALLSACKRNHLDMVRLLEPHSNPKHRKSECLLWAVAHDNWDMAKLLLPRSNIQHARAAATEWTLERLERWYGRWLAQTISDQLPNAAGSSLPRKM